MSAVQTNASVLAIILWKKELKIHAQRRFNVFLNGRNSHKCSLIVFKMVNLFDFRAKDVFFLTFKKQHSSLELASSPYDFVCLFTFPSHAPCE